MNNVSVGAKEPYSLYYSSFFGAFHVIGFIGCWYAYEHASSEIVKSAIQYFFACHLSITILAHRYGTHGALEMHPWVQWILAFLFSGVWQGALIFWIGKHLQHHQNEDRPGLDPHTPMDGFFHSHMGWLMKESGWTMPSARYTLKFAEKRDKLNRYQAIRWQSVHYWWLMPLMSLGVPAFIGWLHGDILGGILVIGFARLIVQWHATWIVNSVGHTFGERSDNMATNFGWLLLIPFAILTVGEAWHANHHRSSAHWRLGRKWWQLDPGGDVIWCLYQLGLAWDLKSPADRLRPPAPRPA